MDLIARSKEFAINAHTRIDHRRKYTKQPYSDHLAAVAKLVGTITDDPAIIAAAWLHDVVEDTPATLYDIETEFGPQVASLVAQLTDVSKPSDGNRATRKEIDRQHLAQASPAAQTVKLADLINNGQDICKHDPRFALVYLQEMQALLKVLTRGNGELYKQAQRTHERCTEKLKPRLARLDTRETTEPRAIIQPGNERNRHQIKLFSEAFTAQDIAEPLRSFDAEQDCAHVARVMRQHAAPIVSIRKDGVIRGYSHLTDIEDGKCLDHFRPFRQGQVIESDASLSDVIHILTLHQFGFITTVGEISGYFSRDDISKPVVRMWLFGILTFIEMELIRTIEEFFPDESWQDKLSAGRLAKAREMQDERARRGQQSKLIDCLQFSDKGQILMQNNEVLSLLGVDSRRTAKKLVREMESLRNNLAHAQDIVTYDWAPIVRLTYRIEESMGLRSKGD